MNLFILIELTTFLPVCFSKASRATLATEPPRFATLVVLSALYISLQMTLNELLLPRMEKSLMRFPAFQKLEEVVVVAEATAIVAHSSRKANE